MSPAGHERRPEPARDHGLIVESDIEIVDGTSAIAITPADRATQTADFGWSAPAAVRLSSDTFSTAERMRVGGKSLGLVENLSERSEVSPLKVPPQPGQQSPSADEPSSSESSSSAGEMPRLLPLGSSGKETSLVPYITGELTCAGLAGRPCGHERGIGHALRPGGGEANK